MDAVRTRNATHPLLIIAAIAIILFCAAGFAAIMGWIPKSGADSDVPAKVSESSSQAVASTSKPEPGARESKNEAAAPHTNTKIAAREPATRQKPAAAEMCRNCGVIESVRAVEKAGDANGVGAVAGGVVGGVVGHQVGNGRGQDLATVAGAVGGAFAGHQIEKHVKKTTVYQVTVRFDDGTTRVLNRSKAPSWRSGDRVRVVNGDIQAI